VQERLFDLHADGDEGPLPLCGAPLEQCRVARDPCPAVDAQRLLAPGNQKDETDVSPSPKGVKADLPGTSPPEDFAGERKRLMKAEALLHCLTVSLNYSSWYPVDGTTYSVAVDVARDLVRECMDQLEQRDRQIEAGKQRTN
jgi:hypothetical protein